MNKFIGIDDLDKINYEDLDIYSLLISYYGDVTELNLYEEALKIEPKLKDSEYTIYENLSELMTFITKRDVDPSEFIIDNEKLIDDLIDTSQKIKTHETTLKEKYKVQKENLKNITDEIDKKIPLMIMPNYYLSFPIIFNKLKAFNSGVYGKKDKLENQVYLIENIGILNLSGTYDKVPKKLFYETVSVLNEIKNKYLS